MSNIRTRFAPSPTGYLHVGGIRTALFAWLLARQNNGQFILRLEDTDQAREVSGADQHIMDSLRALGLEYDEGPDTGGKYGPYRQSERLELYKQWAQKLYDEERAYADPYTPDEVQAFRESAQKNKQPFLYRNHRPTDPPKWDGSQPLRFKSDPKAYKWHDEVMGDLSTGPEVIDDIILIKSDGFPTYNFAHIIDDMLMECTHVIRGQEFLASTPNYLNLYEALGFDMTTVVNHERPARALGEGGEAMNSLHSKSGGRALPIPILATMPHILGPSGDKKLSKRDGAKDVLDYIREGYLPEALINFVASLGWNDGTEQEIFSVPELVKKFSLDRVQKSGARFDEQRLLWMNGAHIRELSLDDLYEKVQNFWPNEATESNESYKKNVLKLVQERLKYFAELPDLTMFFFKDLPVNEQLVQSNKQLARLQKNELKGLLEDAKKTLANSDFTLDDLTKRLNELLESTGQKPAVLFSLIRIATTQAPASPALAETLAILGKKLSMSRLQQQLDALE